MMRCDAPSRKPQTSRSSRPRFSFEPLESRLLLSHKGPCPGSPHCLGGDEPPPPEPPADPAIAFISTSNARGSSVAELMVMNADGTNQTSLLSGQYDVPNWSPDLDGDAGNGYQGSIVVESTTAEFGRQLLLLDVSIASESPRAENVRVLVDANDPNVASMLSPVWSPDLDSLTAGYQGQIAFHTGVQDTINVIDV